MKIKFIFIIKMNSNKIVNTAILAFNARHAVTADRIRHGDLEIILRDGLFYFISRGGARIANIREIQFYS